MTSSIALLQKFTDSVEPREPVITEPLSKEPESYSLNPLSNNSLSKAYQIIKMPLFFESDGNFAIDPKNHA